MTTSLHRYLQVGRNTFNRRNQVWMEYWTSEFVSYGLGLLEEDVGPPSRSHPAAPQGMFRWAHVGRRQSQTPACPPSSHLGVVRAAASFAHRRYPPLLEETLRALA